MYQARARVRFQITADRSEDGISISFFSISELGSGIYCVMGDETSSETYEKRAWEYFLQLQPIITDVNAAAEMAFRAVDAFEKELKRRKESR